MSIPNQGAETRIVIENPTPTAGICSLVVGFIGVFILSFILSPLALILGIVALFQGGVSGVIMGLVGIVLSVVGTVTSPILMGLLGLASLLAL